MAKPVLEIKTSTLRLSSGDVLRKTKPRLTSLSMFLVRAGWFISTNSANSPMARPFSSDNTCNMRQCCSVIFSAAMALPKPMLIVRLAEASR